MTRIGLLSDTHGYWDERYLKYFEPCDQIWHAGDIGSMEIVERLEAFRPLKAVYGNIDGQDMRRLFRNRPLHSRRSRRTDEAHRRLSGKIRCFDTLHLVCQPSPAFYQRTLAYSESKIRQVAEPVAHKSGSSRNIRFSYRTHPCTFLYRQWQFFRLGSNRIKQVIVCLIEKTFRNL